jgi:hypothetical protein
MISKDNQEETVCPIPFLMKTHKGNIWLISRRNLNGRVTAILLHRFPDCYYKIGHVDEGFIENSPNWSYYTGTLEMANK